MPHLVGVLLGHSADSLPLLLHGHELIGGLAPFGAVFQSLGALTQSNLAFEIL